MPIHLSTKEINQGSAGFLLRLPFSLSGYSDSYLGQTWRVKLVTPDGTIVSRTSGIEFLTDAPIISVPIEDFDLILSGTYYYQVTLTTSASNINSSVESFFIAPSLPEGLPYSIISSAFNYFPIFTSGGALAQSTLRVDVSTNLNYTGGGAVFAGQVTLADEAYTSSWNGKFEAPTKNAIYDALNSGTFGEVNTASNVGTSGIGVFHAKSSADLQFRKLNSTTNRLGIVLNTNQIDFTINEGNLSIASSQVTGDFTQSRITNLVTDLSNKQTLNANLTTISGLSPTNDDVLQRKAGAWINRTPAQLKTDLGLVKADVGLGNVDNTSDALKLISTATQAVLDLKANLTGASFSGPVNVVDVIYGAGWNDNTSVPTKNAIYDKIETVVSNVTHTGEVTGATVLTIDKTAITGKTAVTAVGSDYVLISDTSDSGNLKKSLVSDFTATIADGDKGDITVSSVGTVWTIDNDVVTYAKIQNVTNNTILGRIAGTTGDIEELTAANVKTILALTSSDVGLGNVTNNAQLKIASNLSDLANLVTARTNLGLGTVATLNTGTASGNVPLLGAGGLLANSVLPPLSLTDVSVVATQAAQLALTAEEGDVAIRSDLNKSYIHNGGVAGTMADWNELLTPTDAVLSVNGYTGVISLVKADIGLSAVSNALQLTVANNLSDLGNTSAARTNLGVAIGSNVQSYSAYLQSISGLSPSNDDFMQYKAGAWANRTVNQVKTDLGISGTTSGTNTGDVTLAGENYLAIVAQVITVNAVNVSGTHITGVLKATAFPALVGDVTTVAGALATTINLALTPTWTGTHIWNKAGITTTYTDSNRLINTTLATSGVAVQQSPSLRFTAHVWNTTATAADNTFDVRETLIPTSGATPSALLTWRFSNNGAAYATTMSLSNTGNLETTTFNGVPLIATGLATKYLAENGTYTVPAGSGVITVGTTTVTSGATTKVLYNNAGVVGEYTVSGSGNVAMTTSPVFTTPNIGVATGSISGNAGSATVLATARAIYGNNFDGSTALTQIIASTYGGTGNGFTKFSGPTTAEKTKTLRDATDTILELGGSYTPTGIWTSLTMVTPVLGIPTSGNLANCTFPTLNQNTTGSSATWTTARNLAGNSVNGSANVAFSNKFIVQGTTDAGLSAAQFLGALGTGIVKNTTTTGVLSIAVNSDLPVMSSTVGGAVPTPPNNTTTFLRGDGTFATPSSGGDMLLGSAQTNTAAKTFLDGTLLLRNVANTFSSQFTNSATAARTYTLKDASGTIAFTSDITGTNSNTNTGDQTTITGNAGTATILQTARTIGGVSFNGSANITVATAIGGFTISGGNLALEANSITMSGSIGVTGTRVTKGWFTDLEVTNNITGSITGNAATVTTNANLTGDVTSSGNATALAIVNSNVGTFNSVTVNAKGLVTAASNVTSSSFTEVGNTSTSFAIKLLRNTDTSPLGFLIYGRNAADNATLFSVDVSGNVIGNTIVKSGGTAAQFLKADGSTDSSTYLVTNQVVTLSGDVGGSGTTAITTTIGANKVLTSMILDANVTLAKLANLAANSVIGNSTGSVATPTAVSMLSTAAANSILLRDTNANAFANNFLSGYASTATAAGTTTLTVSSTRTQNFTGTTTQTVVLPVVSTLVSLGHTFEITNNSTGLVTVQSSGANNIQVMAANTRLIVVSNATSGTAASVWNANYISGLIIGNPISGGSNNAILYKNASGALTTDGNFTYDGSRQLHINGGAGEAIISTGAGQTLRFSPGNGTTVFNGHFQVSRDGDNYAMSVYDITDRIITLDSRGRLSTGGTYALTLRAGTTKGIFFEVDGTTAIGNINILGNMALGVADASARLHLLSTTEQLRVGYDAVKYFTTTVGSTGSTTFDLVGTTPRFLYSKGVTLPTGTATAGTAPLKMVTGTALTSAEDGAVEYHSSHLYFTIGSTRYQLDQQSASLVDGDKGDITVSGSGATWTIDNGVLSLAKMADVATSTVFYRKTAATGVPEVQTLATLKTDLGLTGTNNGDQTTSGITNRISVTTGTTNPVIDISSAYVGQTSITTLGTITGASAIWQGTIVGSTYGGTGINNAGRTLTINTNSGTLDFGAASKTLTINNSLGLTGTDGTTMTFPAVSATVAGLGISQTFTGINAFTPTARASGVASYLTITTPADTGITTATESVGLNFTAATRTWADGTTTLQRERVFGAPTYNRATTSAIFTTAVNVDISDPIAGTGVTFTNAYGLRAANVLFTGVIKAGSASTTLTDSAGKILSAALNTVAIAQGGTGTVTYVLGDLLYSDATNSLARLTGNITTTRKFLRQTGNGSVSAVPVWDTLTSTDVGLGNVTNFDQTNASNITSGTLATARLGTIVNNTVLYANGSGVLSSNANLGWNGSVLSVTGNVSVTDEAYGVSWNSSVNTPTKKAIFDRTQILHNYKVIEDYSNNLTTALSDLGTSTTVELRIGSVVNVTADTVIPPNVYISFNGYGSFNISAGITLTIRSLINPGDRKLYTGAGKMVISRQPEVQAVWWTGKMPNVDPLYVDMTSVQWDGIISSGYGGLRVVFSEGRWRVGFKLFLIKKTYSGGVWVDTSPTALADGINLIGQSGNPDPSYNVETLTNYYGTIIQQTANNISCIEVPSDIRNLSMENICFYMKGTTGTIGVDVIGTNIYNIHMNKCSTYGGDYGIRIKTTYITPPATDPTYGNLVINLKVDMCVFTNSRIACFKSETSNTSYLFTSCAFTPASDSGSTPLDSIGVWLFYSGTTKFINCTWNGYSTNERSIHTYISSMNSTSGLVTATGHGVAVGQVQPVSIRNSQLETNTVSGTVSTSGDARIIVSSDDSGKFVGATAYSTSITVDFAVLNTETASQVATKARTALNLNAYVTQAFEVGGTGADITLLFKAGQQDTLNDASITFSVQNKPGGGGSVGITTTNSVTTAATTTNLPTGTVNYVDKTILYFAAEDANTGYLYPDVTQVGNTVARIKYATSAGINNILRTNIPKKTGAGYTTAGINTVPFAAVKLENTWYQVHFDNCQDEGFQNSFFVENTYFSERQIYITSSLWQSNMQLNSQCYLVSQASFYVNRAFRDKIGMTAPATVNSYGDSIPTTTGGFYYDQGRTLHSTYSLSNFVGDSRIDIEDSRVNYSTSRTFNILNLNNGLGASTPVLDISRNATDGNTTLMLRIGGRSVNALRAEYYYDFSRLNNIATLTYPSTQGYLEIKPFNADIYGGVYINGHLASNGREYNTKFTILGNSGTINIDGSLGSQFSCSPSGDITFTTSNFVQGQRLSIQVTADTTNKTITWGSGIYATGGRFFRTGVLNGFYLFEFRASSGGTLLQIGTPRLNTNSNVSPQSEQDWGTNTATTLQLYVGDRKEANNASLTTFTLPSNPVFGDTIGVKGTNSGKFRIGQNASQLIRWSQGSTVGVDVTTTGIGGYIECVDGSACVVLMYQNSNVWSPISTFGDFTLI